MSGPEHGTSPPPPATAADAEPLPSVTVVMPVYNEQRWIERSLAAVLAQDYPEHLVEILIADCRSDDATLGILRRVASSVPGRRLRLFENSDRTPGAALNLLVAHAEGEIVVRVDGHAEIAPDYVRACVAALQHGDALNVGGNVSACGFGFVGRAIAIAIGSFWGNGGARYRSSPPSRPEYVDTVQFGAWRRETLLSLGPFVANWSVNEDCEFNARIRDAGGKILLHPAIRALYFPRGSLPALAKQYFRYGRWKCRVIARHPRQLRARQVAPLLLVLGLIAHVPLLFLGETVLSVMLAGPIAYTSAITAASVFLAFRSRRLLVASVLPAVLATLHLSYGAGALVGLVQMGAALLFGELRRRRRRPARSDARRAAEGAPLADGLLEEAGDG